MSVSKGDWAKEGRWEEVLDNPAVPIWMKPLLVVYRNIWEALERERRDLDAMVVEEQSRWPEAGLLRQIPGYGPIVTLAVLNSLDDPHRFKHSGQVASYAGLVPSCRDSGNSKRRGGITHQRLIVKRGVMVAVVALARRLLILGIGSGRTVRRITQHIRNWICMKGRCAWSPP